MVTRTRRPLAFAILTLLGASCLGATTAHAVDPAASCQVSKRKAAGKKVKSKLNCVAAAAGRGLTVSSSCIAKAEVKFSTSFAKAIAKGGCPSGQSAATVEATVDACVSDMRSVLGASSSTPPQSSCTASKLKATGNKTAAKIACYNRAIPLYAPVDSTCLAKAEVRFSTAFAKAVAKGTCTGSTASAEAEVDACISDISSNLPAPSLCGPESATFMTTGVTAAHNNVRANATPTPNPPLPALCYSPTVATTAQAWADGCVWMHNPNRGSLGENIYASSIHESNAVVAATNLWASEGAYYDYATNTCTGSPYGTCGHYKQVVRRATLRIGCGVKFCNGGTPPPGFPSTWTFVVCDYQPPGSGSGQPY